VVDLGRLGWDGKVGLEARLEHGIQECNLMETGYLCWVINAIRLMVWRKMVSTSCIRTAVQTSMPLSRRTYEGSHSPSQSSLLIAGPHESLTPSIFFPQSS